VVGGVVIVGSNESGNASGAVYPAELRVKDGALACTEMLGQTVLGRMTEELVRGGVDSLAVIAHSSFASAVLGEDKVDFFAAQDLWQCGAEKITSFNAEAVLVMRLGAYVEFDPADLLQSHREQGNAVTRAYNNDGRVDLWVMDPAILSSAQEPLKVLEGYESASYFVPGYVNRLDNARDMRQLICDALARRSQFRPLGVEVKPGIWMGHGAQVERGARIVAPAFIGRDSKIADQCLITRGTNVESNSHVDYGTVIEDSSVLSNTYVGIGLDLSHSIVDGDNLLNLQHGVMLKISDPVVLRQMRDNRVRSGKDGSFLANLGVGDIAMSSVPEEQQ
jgi:hypothetical protein